MAQRRAVLIPPRPSNVPSPNQPEPAGIVTMDTDMDTVLGVGHLRPRFVSFLDEPDQYGNLLDAGWLEEIALPLYATPDGDLWGWLTDGWLIPTPLWPRRSGH